MSESLSLRHVRDGLLVYGHIDSSDVEIWQFIETIKLAFNQFVDREISAFFDHGFYLLSKSKYLH